MEKVLAVMFLAVIIFPLASGLVQVSYPDPAIININQYNPSQVVEFENLNLSFVPTVSLSLSSGLNDKVSLSKSSLDVSSLASMIVSMKNSSSPGSYSGYLNWADPDGSGQIPLSVTIPESQQQVNSDIIVFPTSKTITVQQGQETVENILINVPGNYPRTITINALNFNPGTETIYFGDLNLGQIPPGNSLQIPITYSGVDAQTGTYQTSLSILATDSEGQVQLPTISLTLRVKSGVAPDTGDVFTNPPTCSLSSTNLNLNSTYSFTCSNVVSNLDIDIPANDYFVGESVDISSGNYIYKFKPTKYGNTHFRAEFKYKGASIFSPFDQEIRITSTGSSVPGTNLKLKFTPELSDLRDSEEALIQVIDNKTGSLVNDPRLWIDAIEVNSTSETFKYSFKAKKDYEIRARSPGYEDLVQTIKIDPKDIGINISPDGGDANTLFNITTNPINASILINDDVVDSPYYGQLSPGLNIIKTVYKGYQDTYKNVTVQDLLYIASGGEQFEKDVVQIFKFNKNFTTYKIIYLKDINSVESELVEEKNIISDKIEFIPQKNGIYQIYADDKIRGTYTSEGFNWNAKWWFMPWYIWIIGIVGLGVVGFIILRNYGGSSSSESYPDVGFSSSITT